VELKSLATRAVGYTTHDVLQVKRLLMEGEKSEKSEKNVCDRGLRLPSKYMLILCYMRTK